MPELRPEVFWCPDGSPKHFAFAFDLFLSFGKTEKFDKCSTGLTPRGRRARKIHTKAKKKKRTCKTTGGNM